MPRKPTPPTPTYEVKVTSRVSVTFDGGASIQGLEEFVNTALGYDVASDTVLITEFMYSDYGTPNGISALSVPVPTPLSTA